MSVLEQKLAAREFVVTAELPVIDSGGRDEVGRQLEPMRPFVDAFNVTDNPSARAHSSPLAVSIAVRLAGAEPILQLTCRDRNRLALEADLMGAALHGVENLCCLSGDGVAAGDEPEARAVFDLDAPRLIALARTLQTGHYLSGRTIDPPPHFLIGGVESPGVPPVEDRITRATVKAQAGARFLQLQPCYRPERLERFVAAAEAAGLIDQLALIPSVWILRGTAGMRFVAGMPGLEVPPETVARVQDAADAEAECLEIACELAGHAMSLPGVAGLHFISFRKDAGIAKLCARLGIPPKVERETHGYSASVAV